MPKHLKLSKSGFPFLLPDRAELHIAEALREALEKVTIKIQAIHDVATEDLVRINGDPRFTEQGRRAEKAELTEKIGKQLDAVEKEIKGWSDNANQKLRALQRKDPARADRAAEDRIVAEIRHQEIRTAFAKLDPAMRVLRLKQAITEGDVELIDAVAGAPKINRLLKEKDLTDALSARLEAIFPEESKEIADLITVHRLASSAIKTTWKKLKNDGLLPRRDSLEDIRQKAAIS